MRIATLANASVIHTRRWVEYFRSRGHEVGLWSLEAGPEGLGARALPRFPLPGFARYPLALPALKRALAQFAPDLVDAHYVPNYGLLGALAGRRPLAVTAWGSDLLVSGVESPFQARRTRLVLRSADLVLADSQNLGRAARALGAPAERVRVIPWGVDLTRFRASRREPGLLISSRMHEPIYDLPTLFHAVRPIMEERAAARLVIAGGGRLTAALERLASELLPAGRYAFVGKIDPAELAAWLGRAEVYLSASRSDSTSVSLLEAMASGAIPVISDLEGNREWVSEGDGARLFRCGDVAEVTRAIRGVLDEPEWAEAARVRNRRTVEEHADESVNMVRIESLFESLARGRDLEFGQPVSDPDSRARRR